MTIKNNAQSVNSKKPLINGGYQISTGIASDKTANGFASALASAIKNRGTRTGIISSSPMTGGNRTKGGTTSVAMDRPTGVTYRTNPKTGEAERYD